MFEEIWLIVDDLYTQAFASSATDQNGVELAALYTLQHRLTGNTESPRCGLHDDISLGGVIDERLRRASVMRMHHGAPEVGCSPAMKPQP
ncbi:hypothetical protein KNO81_41910 [Paraburkholderia sediminicola]|nr:hypothetical protein [Paraburkholderia sediminicola]